MKKRKPIDVFYAYNNAYYQNECSETQGGYDDGVLVKSYTSIGSVMKRIKYGLLYDHLEDRNNETD